MKQVNEVNTDLQYDDAVNNCREIFLKKNKDYGTSWRVYRSISISDQIYIKAKRIRNIQEKKVQKIEDDVKGEFKGIVNYAVIGLIQLDIDAEDADPDDPVDDGHHQLQPCSRTMPVMV